MELKDFVSATLTQVIEGVKMAQSASEGGNINAKLPYTSNFGGSLLSLNDGSVFTRVDFDVSVTAEVKGGANAKLTVFGIGAEGGAAHTSGAANRVAFSVPIRLPSGDATRARDYDREISRTISETDDF